MLILKEWCRHQVAINYSAEDPSGQRLITLGDDNKVQLHLRDSSGRALPILGFHVSYYIFIMITLQGPAWFGVWCDIC
jgi:hypothetical protein